MAEDPEPQERAAQERAEADTPAGELAGKQLDEVAGGHGPSAPAPGGIYGSVGG
jgi:hypothetical protein